MPIRIEQSNIQLSSKRLVDCGPRFGLRKDGGCGESSAEASGQRGESGQRGASKRDRLNNSMAMCSDAILF